MKIHVSRTKYLRGYIGPGDQGFYGVDATDKRLDALDEDQHKNVENGYDHKEVFTMGKEFDLEHTRFIICCLDQTHFQTLRFSNTWCSWWRERSCTGFGRCSPRNRWCSRTCYMAP